MQCLNSIVKFKERKRREKEKREKKERGKKKKEIMISPATPPTNRMVYLFYMFCKIKIRTKNTIVTC